jgi:hypothetical protein
MEQTLQAQYNLIKEGKGNKAYFLKSAYRLFPDMLSPVNTFEDTTRILKNRGIISEGIGGLVTSGKKQDWHAIFNENMDKLKDEKDEEDEDKFAASIEDFEKKDTADTNISPINYRNLKEDDAALKKENVKKAVEYYNQNAGRISMKDAASKFNVTEFEVISALNQGATSGIRFENINEAKEKEPSKEVLDNQKNNFDYKDEKNYDNLFGEQFLQGYYVELKDPKNADKNVEELRAIVAKNLAKDKQYYVKNGQFGTKGLGYTTEAPGLGAPKEPKGKYASSGYGDIPKSDNLQESILRSQIHLLIKEVLNEMPLLKAGEMGTYEGKPVFIIAISNNNNEPKYVIKKDGKIYKNIDINAVTKTVNELQQEPVAHADEEEFEDRIIAKLKSELRTKNKHHQNKYGEPDMDLESYYDDAMKFVSQNIKSIAKKFLNHSKPEGGVSDAVKYALSNVDSNPIHEKKNPSAGLTKKEKSAVSKKLHKGEDIGKKGKGFEKVAKAAEKEYGSKEAGKRVAAAAMWKNLAKKK